ncbi:phytoene/squalene synthase family protein [Flavitalea flava]
MKSLYDKLSVETSKMTTGIYSTSFSLGIYFLNNRLRNPVHSIYGFVRLADEIVDSFDGYDKKNLLARLEQDTYEAMVSGISINPILNSFQQAVHQYHIDPVLISVFLQSMKMDLEKMDYTVEKYQQYILGSAEVVGLMCLHVFTEGDLDMYEELKPYAMKLGAAFQKVNFLRDIKDDYQVLGRVYFPEVDMSEFTCQAKKQIEKDIEADFKIALAGIYKLPASSKRGVYLAYVYYQSLFTKIKKIPAQQLLKERIRINNGRKIGLMINSLFPKKVNWV